MSTATFGTSGDVRTCSNISFTRASGISRSSSKRLAMCVGAVGEYGSTFLTARKSSRRTRYRVSGSAAFEIFRSAGAGSSVSLTAARVTSFVNGFQSTCGLSTTISGIV